MPPVDNTSYRHMNPLSFIPSSPRKQCSLSALVQRPCGNNIETICLGNNAAEHRLICVKSTVRSPLVPATCPVIILSAYRLVKLHKSQRSSTQVTPD